MPVVRPYPIGEVSPQPLPNVAPNVPAAGDIALFGGNRARDLQLAGQQLGQASDSLFALYQRHAQEANDTRVQDLTNRFLDGRRAILQTGPDAYYNLSGADAVAGADAAAAKLTSLKDSVFGEAANDDQRHKLAPILAAHLAASTEGIKRHAVGQQAVYSRGVAANAIETAQAEATADPANMDYALHRAEGAARALHAGQPTEAIEAGVRAAGSSVIAGVIGDRLARNDPHGVALFRQYTDRLDPNARRTLGAAAETLSNSLDAAAWLRDRSATQRTPAPTGDQALDAVNSASASIPAPAPVTSSSGVLLDEDGIIGTRVRLDEIDERHRALTALNQQEFATNPKRLRANQAAIDTDTARSRAAVKAETDSLYADLRRYLTTGGPNGGPAVTPPPATIMSCLADAQQDAVTAQVNGNIEGRKTGTDPQTWYAIRQGLTAADANERDRWASKNLVQFMGSLSAEDFAVLEKLQAAERSNDGGVDQSRLQLITWMANEALQTAGIDPTPWPDASPDSDAGQAARFHRALQDELSALESEGRKPMVAETYGIINDLKDMAIKSGWLEASGHPASPTAAFGGSEGYAQGVDPNIVRVAGDDKEKEDMRRRLPGSANRPRLGRDNEMPPAKQINPLAIPGGGGGRFKLPSLSRPSPSAGETALKPAPPPKPSPGTGQSPPVSGASGGAKIPAESAPPSIAADFPAGSFSISDWSAYPAAIVPQPQGPFRIVQGLEYISAKIAKKRANAAFRKKQGLVGQPGEVHELHPVKFGGSPTDPANKVVVPRDVHRQQVTPWWNKLQKDLGY